jgi:sugar lactone lactonase YvrE
MREIMKQPYSMSPSGWKTCLLVFTLLCVSGSRLAAADPEQHLYAGIGPHLHQFSLDGKSRIYATLPGVLSGFDVDEDGTFWATTGNKLYRVDRHSNEAPATVQNKGVTEFATGLGQCRGMAIDPNGDFWIADRGKGDRSIGIIKIDRQTGGKTLIKEKSDDVKGNIYSVERGPNGNLYASAQSGHTVTEFKPDGTPVRGTPEKPEPLISGHGAAGHRAIVFDVNGDILFIGVDGIERFDSNGTHLGTFFKWTGEGFNDGKLDRADFIARGAKHPMDLAVDQNGIIYGSDNGYDKKKGQEVGGAIYRYHKDGSRELFFEAGPRPNYLTFWPRTRISPSQPPGKK